MEKVPFVHENDTAFFIVHAFGPINIAAHTYFYILFSPQYRSIDLPHINYFSHISCRFKKTLGRKWLCLWFFLRKRRKFQSKSCIVNNFSMDCSKIWYLWGNSKMHLSQCDCNKIIQSAIALRLWDTHK